MIGGADLRQPGLHEISKFMNKQFAIEQHPELAIQQSSHPRSKIEQRKRSSQNNVVVVGGRVGDSATISSSTAAVRLTPPQTATQAILKRPRIHNHQLNSN